MPEHTQHNNATATAEEAARKDNTETRHSQETPDRGTYLCFDFGGKRIGIAVGHTDTGQASPLETIRNINGRPEWEKIDKLVERWQPAGFVVGLPLQDDGEHQMQLTLSRSFCKKLTRRYTLKAYRNDERYTSIEASRILAENRKTGNRRKATRADIDKIAAAIILEHWFAETA